MKFLDPATLEINGVVQLKGQEIVCKDFSLVVKVVFHGTWGDIHVHILE